MWDGFAVPEEPELLGGHARGRLARRQPEAYPARRSRRVASRQYARIGGPVILTPAGVVQRAR
jgi:hypothetical protein